MSSDARNVREVRLKFCLNPFGTGQCLPTSIGAITAFAGLVSIPLEQGNVFRQ